MACSGRHFTLFKVVVISDVLSGTVSSIIVAIVGVSVVASEGVFPCNKVFLMVGGLGWRLVGS